MKIFKDLNNGKNMVFNAKKLLNNRVNLQIPAECIADIADLGRRWSVLSGEHINANV
jgi:hypothetical protein